MRKVYMSVNCGGGNRSEVFLKDNEVEIVAERAAEAFVSVGKGSRFRRENVASAFIPGDESISDVDDCHLDTPSAAIFCEVFGVGQKGAA